MSQPELTVLYSFPNPLGAPGIGQTAFQQIDALTELGHRCVVYCTSVVRRPRAAELVETLTLGTRRVPHRAFGAARTARSFHDRVVARALRRGAGDVDVVHAWPQGCAHTFVAASQMGIPTFREVPNTHTANAYDVMQSVTTDLGIELPRGHSHRPNERTLDREATEYERADRLLVPSEHVARTFLERGIDGAKLARHRYGCDLARFQPSRREGPSDRGVVVLFAGRIEPRKGVHVLLDAWQGARRPPNAELILVGSFVPAYEQVLASRLNDPSIRVVPFSDEPEALMADADVFVLPSFEEGSALVTYEAQAAGCALLVSDAAGAMCDDGVHGLVHTAGDAGALRHDLEALMWDRPRLEQFRARVVADRERLSWVEAGRVIGDRYRSLLP